MAVVVVSTCRPPKDPSLKFDMTLEVDKLTDEMQDISAEMKDGARRRVFGSECSGAPQGKSASPFAGVFISEQCLPFGVPENQAAERGSSCLVAVLDIQVILPQITGGFKPTSFCVSISTGVCLPVGPLTEGWFGVGLTPHLEDPPNKHTPSGKTNINLSRRCVWRAVGVCVCAECVCVCGGNW